jgi:hypothetical protein
MLVIKYVFNHIIIIFHDNTNTNTTHYINKKKELVDMATVSDQEIKSDDIVYMVFVKETGTGFEEIAVDNLVPFGDDENKGI